MTDPQETSQNVETAAHSAGEPDLNAPEKNTGSDVGGPSAAMESSLEEGLSGVSTVGAEDDPHDQAKNPN